MKFRNLLKTLMVAVMISITIPAISNPGADVPKGKEPNAVVQPMLQRLQQIKDMDKSSLSKSERKELRNEVKNIKKEVKANSNGIYLSIGAIVIIVLLLILLL